MTYHASDIASQTHQADPQYGVDPEWQACVRDENDDVIAVASGPSADHAIVMAQRIAWCLNQCASRVAMRVPMVDAINNLGARR